MRLFNEDFEIKDVYDVDMSRYYDLFSIGITTSAGRFDFCQRLVVDIAKSYPTIPLHIIINYIGEDTYYKKWDKFATVKVEEELRSITWAKNQHMFFYPDRPYLIMFDDDCFFTNPKAIDNLIYAHLKYKFDMIRGYCNNCCDSYHKGMIAEINWWDERFMIYHDDTDLHMRLERMRVQKGLEHNKGRFLDNLIIGHTHCNVNNYVTQNKMNSTEMMLKKWGHNRQPNNEHENIVWNQLLDDINLYPEFKTKFMNMGRLHEI